MVAQDQGIQGKTSLASERGLASDLQKHGRQVSLTPLCVASSSAVPALDSRIPRTEQL